MHPDGIIVLTRDRQAVPVGQVDARRERVEERPYVVVVMENYELEDEAAAAMKEVSRTLSDYFWRLGRASRYGTYVTPDREE
jgi:beta-lactamase class A